MMANKLLRRLPAKEWQITVVDRDNLHLYQPGLLFLPFGSYREDELVRPRTRTLDAGIKLVINPIHSVDVDARKVTLEDGSELEYDYLIIATGTKVMPGETEGLTGPGWRQSAFDFYTLSGAKALAEKLDSWEGGRMVLNVVDNPIKCPVAPLEFLFLADAFFTKKGIRDKVEIVYATPLDGAFTKPKASAALGDMLEARNIKVTPDFALAKVDGEKRVLEAYDGTQENYDLLVSVPLHNGAEYLTRSGLGDALGFLPVNRYTLQSDACPRVFGIGDGTNVPASKAGSVAHFQAEVLVENVLRSIEGKDLLPDFDGHANCFIETGFGKAILIDFNYTTEPLPGRFPLPGIGPFTLLEESYVNHWGKLGFKWVYWNMLLKGEELPLDHRMVMAGKWS